MLRITSGVGRKFIGMVGAVALAVLVGGCARQEGAITAQTDTHTQAVAQTDIPEVIVTASRDSTTDGPTMRYE